MTLDRATILRRLATAAAGVASLSVGGMAGLILTFPSAAAKDWLEWKVTDTNKEYALSLGDVSPWLFPGLQASDVTLYTVKKGRKNKDEPNPPAERTPMLHAENVAVRLQVLPRLFGRWAFSVSADLFGGDLDGSVAAGASGADVDLELSDVDLSAVPPLGSGDTSIQLMGKVAIDADLSLDAEEVKSSTGALSVDFEGFGLAAGSTANGLTLPEVAFTRASAKFEAQEGKLVVTEGTFAGDTLDATLSGDIALNKKLLRSRYRLDLVVTLPEDLDGMARISPQLRRARDEDAGYHFDIGGTILQPHFKPGRADGKRGGTGLAGADRVPNEDGPLAGVVGGMDDEDAQEERRRRREERIKERRERLKRRREEADRDNPMNQDDEEPVMPPEDGDDQEQPPRRGRDFGDGGREPEFEPPPPGDMPDMGPPNEEDGLPPPGEE
jgi:type II secretion system protein N